MAIIATLEEHTGAPIAGDDVDHIFERYGHIVDIGHQMLRECIVQAELRAFEDTQAALHRAEGIDDGLVDEAIEFARAVHMERRH